MTRLPARRARPASLLVYAGLFLATACSTDHRGECVETERPVADNEMLPLGYTVYDVLALTPETQAPASWADGAKSTLTVTVSRDPDNAVWVESERSSRRAHPWQFKPLGSSPTLYESCESHLRIPMTLQMQTDDGRLVLSAHSRARSPMYPSLGDPLPSLGAEIYVPFADVGGTLDLDAVIGPRESAPNELLAFAWWSEEDGPNGAMHVQLDDAGDTGRDAGWAADLMYWGAPFGR